MENCIFCKIANGSIPAQKTYEDERVLAFLDIHPKAPGHTLVIPKKHYQWFEEIPEEDAGPFFKVAKELAATLKKEKGADYVHLSIVGTDVPHAHIHLIPRFFKDKPPTL